ADIAVKVAKLGLGFTIDRDAERRDAGHLCFGQCLAYVLACVSRIAVIMIVRPSVRQNDQKLCSRFLPQQLVRGMPYRRSEARVVLESDAADAALDIRIVFLCEILHDVEFYVSPAFARKTVDRINVADRIESFAHQHEAFFLDLDDASAWMCVRLQRISRDRAGGRARLIEQDRDSDVTFAAEAFRIDILVLAAVGLAVDDKIYESVKVVFLAVDLPMDPREILRLHQLELMPDRRYYAAIAATRQFNKGAIARFYSLFDHAAPTDAIVIQLTVPLVVGEGN